MTALALMGSAVAATAAPPSRAGSSVARLLCVDTISPTDGWAVGDVTRNGVTRALIRHWDGRAWRRVPAPNPGGDYGTSLSSVSARDAHDVWAVGDVGTASGGRRTLVLHWDGRRWSRVPSPNASRGGFNVLSGVVALSRTNVWAVGSASSLGPTSRTVALHWTGTRWDVIPTPNPSRRFANSLTSVDGAASGDVWAVGWYEPAEGRTATLVVHWTGNRWLRQTSVDSGKAQNMLTAVSTLGSRAAWAVGWQAGGDGRARPLIERWNGGRWQAVGAPRLQGAAGVLEDVNARTRDDAWAVGYLQPGAVQQTLAMHWDGRRWTRTQTPSPGAAGSTLAGVVVEARDDAWAVGGALDTPESGLDLITRWDGTRWQTSPR